MGRFLALAALAGAIISVRELDRAVFIGSVIADRDARSIVERAADSFRDVSFQNRAVAEGRLRRRCQVLVVLSEPQLSRVLVVFRAGDPAEARAFIEGGSRLLDGGSVGPEAQAAAAAPADTYWRAMEQRLERYQHDMGKGSDVQSRALRDLIELQRVFVVPRILGAGSPETARTPVAIPTEIASGGSFHAGAVERASLMWNLITIGRFGIGGALVGAAILLLWRLPGLLRQGRGVGPQSSGTG